MKGWIKATLGSGKPVLINTSKIDVVTPRKPGEHYSQGNSTEPNGLTWIIANSDEYSVRETFEEVIKFIEESQ